MVDFNPLQRQPAILDFASPSQFRFNLTRVPNVEYFVSTVNIPGISFSGDATVNTRFKSLSLMGDTLDYGDLELSFIVNEDLSNYREIHDWMIGIAFPKNNQQFTNAMNSAPQTKPTLGRKSPLSQLASDATLTILTNKNNPNIRVNFKACYPTTLSGLSYNAQTTDSEQLTANVTFKYDIYEFEVL